MAEANRNANNPSAGFQAAPKSQSNVSARAADEQVANPRRRWSRRFPGRLLGNVAWPADQNQLTVAQEWPDSRSLTIEHPRLDGYDEPPIEGEPAKLLEIWQDKLGLKINDDGQVVPSRPIPVLNALRKL